MSRSVAEILGAAGVVPVIVIEREEQAVPLARALVAGGLPVLEVTFRTAAAAGAIAAIRREVPEAVVGAGTLLTADQVRAAKKAGAAFGVAPGFDPVIVDEAKSQFLPFCPGIATASELSQALTAGCEVVKFFPAEAAGGVKMIKNLLGAFRSTGVRFMPTGGIGAANLSDYLSVPEVICCGGTWVVPKDALAASDYATIERLASEAARAAAAVRPRPVNAGGTVTRRGFVGGMLALVAAGGARRAAAAPGGVAPRLRFGVMSDVHIGGKPDAEATLERALRWFAKENVDAVLCPGDIAHSGDIGELERFAAVWYKVFPQDRAADGHKVELMISTGNHDVDAWGGRWKGFTEEQMLARRFNYKDNAEKTWRRLFGQKWEVVWRREVKGYTFMGSQWSSLNPPVAEYLKDNAASLDPSRPFFYCQHSHPKGTCHSRVTSSCDDGESVRALAPFPNAVAFTGHSHCTIADEGGVWQGAFTSIGAGCIHEAGSSFRYDNVSAFWSAKTRDKLMTSLADTSPRPWGGDAKGGGCELVEVFDDHLVVHRHSVVFGRPIAPAWTVPLPAKAGGPLDFERRAAMLEARGAVPQFAADAKIVAKFCPDGHSLESAAHRGEPCIHVTFPRAKTVRGGRVFEYVVEAAEADGAASAPPVVRRIVAAGFSYPEEDADIPGECLFSAKELPFGRPIRFTVTPRDSFGLAGRALVGNFS